MPTTFSRMLALSLLTVVLGGCGAPPELEQQSAGRSTPTATAVPPATASPTPPTGLPLPPPTGLPSTPGSGAVAVACRNGPSGEQVLRLVRGSAGVLPGDTGVRVRSAPLCTDDWQYTVLAVSGYEDLTVVSQGRPGALRLVTAGTDVCTIEVRTAAPTGIRTLACDGTGGLPGA
ncbi:hypothetical protein GA0074694_1287 [Micromonospora inyonensis]|uniref:Lipoprotein n=2 Tax=Micromonospora inyonensis TaxID=47866 RepID=A0A1C6REM3_9ACTN|nr:hypothetical protein GA0074694_1287 [Micromonospora inyonensis]